MDKKICFIIMPFSLAKVNGIELNEKTLKFIYQDVIKKAVSEYKDNGKEIFTDNITRYESKIGSIIDGIANQLNKADLVIADLSGMNPNVMYELGVRHSLRRGTIIITQNLESIPSDLRDYMCVGYKFSNNTIDQNDNYFHFKEQLHTTIKELFSTDKYDSPVLSYLKGKEKYWREDEEKKLKENIVIANYIHDQFMSIEEGIKAIKEAQDPEALIAEAFIGFSALLNNLNGALNDLNISVEASIMYENIQAAKRLIDDIIKSSFMTEFLSSTLGNLMSENERSIFQAQKISFLDTEFTNYFKLNEDILEKISFKNVFFKEGVFYTDFLEELENHLEKKAKELGLSEEEIDKILST
jgi:hypothetical protein